ncbi:cyclophilin-like fold protein [Enterocloster bolteae]|uniref:cyclophilin-like fold protein n=1 Tax=Enterocloster bolteae TaxID=208479 RepID=UPI002A80413F|nr:cyclophilin-like fold protein [Enterocloster bolteae]
MRRKTRLLGMMTAAALALSACANGSGSQAGTTAAVGNTASAALETTGTAALAPSDSSDDSMTAENGSDSAAAGMLTGTYPDGSTPEYSGVKLKLTVDGEEIIIAMYDNTAVDAFLERLPLEDLHFSDLSGIEKPADRPDEPFSLGDEEPGYDPVTGEMVIYRPWGNFTIFYGDFRHSDELVPLGMVESGLEVLESKADDFTGTLERME